MISQYLSDKIKIISLVSIILVLYIHCAYKTVDFRTQHVMNIYYQRFISDMIGRCAVPMFFCISGFLFFKKTDNGLKSVFTKMHKRIRTILIPFILSIIFFLIAYVIISGKPQGPDYLIYDFPLGHHTFLQNIYAFVADSGTGYPLPFHLWFMRDLILIIMLSPLLYYARKHVNKFLLLGLLLIISTYFKNFQFLPYSLFWFLLGSYFLDIKIKKNWLIPFLFLILCIMELVLPDETWDYFKIPVIITGITSIWEIYDVVIEKGFTLQSNHFLNNICSFTFFIYLYHIPTINIVRKLTLLPFGSTPLGYFSSYTLSPIIFLTIAVIIGMIFKKTLPGIYSICVGGR